MIDLNQVSLALRNCTANSLILLDEFGKGTIPAGSFSSWCKHHRCFLLIAIIQTGLGCFAESSSIFSIEGLSVPKF
jgi:hypothetical protein